MRLREYFEDYWITFDIICKVYEICSSGLSLDDVIDKICVDFSTPNLFWRYPGKVCLENACVIDTSQSVEESSLLFLLNIQLFIYNNNNQENTRFIGTSVPLRLARA